jgi:hypothetical protein
VVKGGGGEGGLGAALVPKSLQLCWVVHDIHLVCFKWIILTLEYTNRYVCELCIDLHQEWQT